MVLRGKIALVTGAGRGIGRAVALALARKGADVAVVDLNPDDVRETAAEVAKLGVRGLALQGSVAEPADVEGFVQRTVEEFGRIDILVNNAGITRDTLLMRMKDEDWDAVIKVNLKGVFLCTRAVSRLMVKQRYGRIINISSVVGLMGNAGQANYSASKAGVIGLTKSAAREMASRNITVNAIAPGFIVTSMTDALPGNVRKKLIEQIPAGRLGMPEDVANAVVFLASDDASYITGQTIAVDGGMVMQ